MGATRLSGLTHTQLEQQPDVLDLGVQGFHLALEFEPGLNLCVELGVLGFAWVVGRVHGDMLAAAHELINPASKGNAERAKKKGALRRPFFQAEQKA